MEAKQTVVDIELLKSGPGRFPQSPNANYLKIPPVTDERVREAAARIASAYLELSNGNKTLNIRNFFEVL